MPSHRPVNQSAIRFYCDDRSECSMRSNSSQKQDNDGGISALLNEIRSEYSQMETATNNMNKRSLIDQHGMSNRSLKARCQLDKNVDLVMNYTSKFLGILMAPLCIFLLICTMSHHHLNSPKVRRHAPSLPQVISQGPPGQCRDHAIVYFVSKSDIRNLEHSLDLLYDHYLRKFYFNSQVFLFHLGDFTTEDLQQLEWRFDEKAKGTIQLVNLADTSYWNMPDFLLQDDMSEWKGLYGLEQRNKHRFFSIKIWDYFTDLNKFQGCNYRYIMRLEPSSFIYSDIQYSIHTYFSESGFQYGFRMCSYEMQMSAHLWQEFFDYTHERPRHQWDVTECAFYNNFFVADLNFMKSARVQRFLDFVEDGGWIYRHKINDSIIHTILAYAFLPTSSIHRFLDFTYQHFEWTSSGTCPRWGGLQQGYNDFDAEQTIDEWIYVYLQKQKCSMHMGNTLPDISKKLTTRIYSLSWEDLSPTYSHVGEEFAHSLHLKSVTTGQVDLAYMGVKSG